MSTTLFTIAGMEQFVPVFLGEQPPPAPRAVTVQRCLRVAGAKSDIENVGRTGRHGTFLEMLGQLQVRRLLQARGDRVGLGVRHATSCKLDPDKLYVTVHTGDDEAERIWIDEIGLDASRITRFDEDNFWTMGPTGPCGPCTEIFYDTGRSYASGPGRYRSEPRQPLRRNLERRLPAVQSRRRRHADGVAAQIDRHRRRLRTHARGCNGQASMYETDLFTDLIAAQPPVGKTSLDPREQRVRQNIVADHARAVTFLINDGVYPSNTDRGYVLRFLIRRAIRNGRLLGYPNGFLTELVPAVVKSLEPGYPELRQNLVAHPVGAAQRGTRPSIARWNAAWRCSTGSSTMRSTNCTRLIGGEDAFVLHDTFGFPIELTREIAGDSGAAVDTVGFESSWKSSASARAPTRPPNARS